MKLARTFGIILCLSICSRAWAGGELPFEFSFTESGGLIPSSPTEGDPTMGISVFGLRMTPDIADIRSLELVLTGLSHSDPMDLDIWLINPFGQTLEIMTDRGGQMPINNFTLTFSDLGEPLPDKDTMLVDGETYHPEGSLGFGGTFVGTSGGALEGLWTLLVIDDAKGGTGELDGFMLRGTAVPEPVTLSLLALGAFAALRRRR